MDIRKYFTPKVASDHNTRKQQSQSSQDNPKKKSKKSAAKSVSPQKTPSKKRKRRAPVIDSDDESVTIVDECSTPEKKIKPDNGVSGVRSSSRTKKSDKKPVAKVPASAADFFGTKKVTSGSTSAPKTIASKLAKESQSKTSKVKAKISKEEIVVLGSDEDWSDDESFVKLIDGKTEEHTDTKFNMTLEQLDRPKATNEQAVKTKIGKVKDSADGSEETNETPRKATSELTPSQETPSTRSSRRTPSKTDTGRDTSKSKKSKVKDAEGDNEERGQMSRKATSELTSSQETPLTRSSRRTPSKAETGKDTSNAADSDKVDTGIKRKHEDLTDTPPKMPPKSISKAPTKPASKTPSKGKPKKGAKYKPLPIEEVHETGEGASVAVSQHVQEETADIVVDGCKPDTPKKARKVNLYGKTFVLTGQMERLERDDAKKLIVKHGGRVVGGISGKVNYLVTGEDAGLAKIAKAEKMSGLKIVNESQFMELLGMSSESGIFMETDEEVPESPSKSEEKVSKQVLPSKASTSTDTRKEQTTPAVRKTRYTSEDLLWVEKYKPTSMAKIIGQTGDKSNANKLLSWLKNWHRHRKLGTKPVSSFGGFRGGDPTGAGFRAALLSGPPGIGKTTSAVLVCKEAGFSFFEMNASDSRSKKILQQTVGQALGNTTLVDFMGERSERQTDNKKHCIIMDEVDGMAGNEDRGGVQELIQLIKGSHIPVICICNDRQSQKIRSLANHCFDLRFQRPRVEQIKAAMKSVCFKEGVQVDGESLNSIIESSNHDIRQVLHNLSVWTASDKRLAGSQAKDDSNKAKKDFKIDAFTACRMAFSEFETAKMSLKDKSDLFFYDYSIHPLFVQENYIHAVPHASKHNSGDTLKRMAKAANSISMGDVISKAIRTDKWGLLPMQAMFSSVLPAEAVMGHLSKQIDFPKWLGKFSTTNKNLRLNKEISMHMGLNVTASARSVCTDYLPILREKLTVPLVKDEHSEGVKQVIGLLEQYDLLKDDYDSILELTQWSGVRDPRTQIESKTKAALTRQYNKSSHKHHYSLAVAPVKKRRTQAAVDDVEEEEGVSDSDQESDEEVVKALKVKPSAKAKAQTKKGKAAADKPKPARGGRKKK